MNLSTNVTRYFQLLGTRRLSPTEENDLVDCLTLFTHHLAGSGQPQQATWLWERCLSFPNSDSLVQVAYNYAKFLIYFRDSQHLFAALRVLSWCIYRDPMFQMARQAADSVRGMVLDRWHFAMLNDTHRNTQYKLAIQGAIKNYYQEYSDAGGPKGQCTGPVVLDIGGGCGLLSIYAALSGAHHVYCCEAEEALCVLARKCIAAAGVTDKVTVVNKMSYDLTIGFNLIQGDGTGPDILCHSTAAAAADGVGDSTGGVDIVVTELLDCGGFGEHIVPVLADARKRLLRKPSAGNNAGRIVRTGGVVIPHSVRVFGYLLESDDIRHRSCTTGSTRAKAAVSVGAKYTAEDLQSYPHTALSDRTVAAMPQLYQLNFAELPQLPPACTAQFTCTAAGRVDGIGCHLEIVLTAEATGYLCSGGADTRMETGSGCGAGGAGGSCSNRDNGREGVVSTAAGNRERCAWQQAVLFSSAFEPSTQGTPLYVSMGDTLRCSFQLNTTRLRDDGDDGDDDGPVVPACGKAGEGEQAQEQEGRQFVAFGAECSYLRCLVHAQCSAAVSKNGDGSETVGTALTVSPCLATAQGEGTVLLTEAELKSYNSHGIPVPQNMYQQAIQAVTTHIRSFLSHVSNETGHHFETFRLHFHELNANYRSHLLRHHILLQQQTTRLEGREEEGAMEVSATVHCNSAQCVSVLQQELAASALSDSDRVAISTVSAEVLCGGNIIQGDGLSELSATPHARVIVCADWLLNLTGEPVESNGGEEGDDESAGGDEEATLNSNTTLCTMRPGILQQLKATIRGLQQHPSAGVSTHNPLLVLIPHSVTLVVALVHCPTLLDHCCLTQPLSVGGEGYIAASNSVGNEMDLTRVLMEALYPPIANAVLPGTPTPVPSTTLPPPAESGMDDGSMRTGVVTDYTTHHQTLVNDVALDELHCTGALSYLSEPTDVYTLTPRDVFSTASGDESKDDTAVDSISVCIPLVPSATAKEIHGVAFWYKVSMLSPELTTEEVAAVDCSRMDGGGCDGGNIFSNAPLGLRGPEEGHGQGHEQGYSVGRMAWNQCVMMALPAAGHCATTHTNNNNTGTDTANDTDTATAGTIINVSATVRVGVDLSTGVLPYLTKITVAHRT